MTKKEPRFLDRVLIACFVSIWVFIVAMLVTYWTLGDIPAELCAGFFSIFGAEGAFCAVIAVAKAIVGRGQKSATDEAEDAEDDGE